MSHISKLPSEECLVTRLAHSQSRIQGVQCLRPPRAARSPAWGLLNPFYRGAAGPEGRRVPGAPTEPCTERL